MWVEPRHPSHAQAFGPRCQSNSKGLVNMLVNRILKHGKKSLAYQILYRAMKKNHQIVQGRTWAVSPGSRHGSTRCR
ncbi:hypothetical protein K4H00_27660, partial [Mycobacterium tuberculosis]|nr:hypothetical protein [Mycobacterium tuberculosis]